MKKIIVLALLVAFQSSTTHAALVSEVDYFINGNEATITVDKLEWLRWDKTINLSINDALELYAGQGWRLASNSEVNSLFSLFLPQADWGDDENEHYQIDVPWNASENSNFGLFVQLFGNTSPQISFNTDEPFTESCALFGSDIDSDNHYNRACIYDDYTYFDELINEPLNTFAYAGISDDNTTEQTISNRFEDAGVALVRSIKVNEPMSLTILLTGALFISLKRRRGYNTFKSNINFR